MAEQEMYIKSVKQQFHNVDVKHGWNFPKTTQRIWIKTIYLKVNQVLDTTNKFNTKTQEMIMLDNKVC